MTDPTSPKAISDLVLLSRCRAAEALGLNLSPSEVMTLAALAAERDRLDMLARGQEEQLEIQGNELARRASRCNELGDRIRELEAQVATERDRLVIENARLRDAVAEVDLLLEALTSVLSWHDKDKHTSGKMTFERSAAFAKARAALAAFKVDSRGG